MSATQDHKNTEKTSRHTISKCHNNIVANMMSRHPIWPAEHSDDKDRELCQFLNSMEDSKDPLLDPLVKTALEDEDYQSLLKAI